MTDCERVLKILKDGKPHMNFDIMNMLGGGFAVAARIWDLRKIDGRYKLNIKYGSPKEFGKERHREGEWWYQLIKPVLTIEALHKAKKAVEDYKPKIQFLTHDHKQLTPKYIKTHHSALDRILA